jgi:hypothetical protein
VNADRFWITASNNFLDQCVLIWCMLFTDRWRDPQTKAFVYGDHHWKIVITRDQANFETKLRQCIGSDLEKYVRKAVKYRNEFLAHLGSKRTMIPPELTPAWRAVCLMSRKVAHGPI